MLLGLLFCGSALAPLYAQRVSGTDPFLSDPAGQLRLGNRSLPLLAVNPGGFGTTPLGPTWRGRFLLGADAQGRDLAARLLYGGRTSLLVSGSATALCLALATLAGLVAGFVGGLADALLSRLLDLLWAFPVYLLAISLSVVALQGGLRLGPFAIASDSLMLPVAIIGVAYVPYVARPLRVQARGLAGADFMLAARACGARLPRLLLREVLPCALPTLATFAPLVMAVSLLTESALSFLGIGVQQPAASWGSLVQDGLGLLRVRPLASILPGLAIAACVLSLSVLGEALRSRLGRSPINRGERG